MYITVLYAQLHIKLKNDVLQVQAMKKEFAVITLESLIRKGDTLPKKAPMRTEKPIDRSISIEREVREVEKRGL